MISRNPASPIKIRKLGHVVYEVSDVARSTAFWTEIMGFHVSDRNENGMVFLHCAGDHHTIALVPSPGKRKPTRPEDGVLQIHHWAMEVESMERLFEARAFLQARGIALTYEGRRGPGSNPGIEFKDPDGFTVEIYCDMDKLDEPGKSRPPEQWKRARSLEEARDNPLE
ncbi:MAG TPA: VOC family protein [Stellaceae bacterium]|nr:VOC family protein [Stellaceae bacterium]